MIITHYYQIDFDCEKNLYIVKNKAAPMCPNCNVLLSGYDSRKRRVIGGDGQPYYFKIRRLLCPSCGHLHCEFPDVIAPGKHYSAEVIRQVRAGESDTCPAEDSTIRRWKREK